MTSLEIQFLNLTAKSRLPPFFPTAFATSVLPSLLKIPFLPCQVGSIFGEMTLPYFLLDSLFIKLYVATAKNSISLLHFQETM